jgi:uncharacterized protein (TIGR02391 family)
MLQNMYKPVTRIRVAPDGTEDRAELKAHVQSSVAFLPITADVEEDDLLERKLPNGKTQTIRLTQVTHNEAPGAGRHLDHIEAKFVSARPRPQVAQRKVTLPGLHTQVSDAAGALYEDGHYSRAIGAAFQAVEARVQTLTGSSEVGQKLMGSALGGALDVTTSVGANRDSERDGFKLLFMGAMAGLRNPRAHGVEVPVDSVEALEALAFASLLMRRLDKAEERREADDA